MSLLQLSHTLLPYTTLFRSGCEPRLVRLEDVGTPEVVVRTSWRRCGPSPGERRQGRPKIHRVRRQRRRDRKSTRLNSSHPSISYAVFCLKKKKYKDYIGGYL